MASPVIPLIVTLSVVGSAGAYYYYNIHCPDIMERDDEGECVCPEGYYVDPDDDQKCVAHPTTEAPACTGVLVDGVYVYDADGDAIDLSDDATEVQIDCLLCNACAQDQADDGRCLRCQPITTQDTWRDEDSVLTHEDWIEDYHTNNNGTTTPISSDYAWSEASAYDSGDSEAESYRADEVSEVKPNHSPLTYNPTSGPVIQDNQTGVSTHTGWGKLNGQ